VLASYSQFGSLLNNIRRYFSDYGGWKNTVYSPFVSMSIIITFLNYSGWMNSIWVEQSFDLIPSLLGFSLGTYAILFSIISGRLKRALKLVKNIHGVSYLDEVNATFFHFIFVQVFCLVWAFLYSGTWYYDILMSISNLKITSGFDGRVMFCYFLTKSIFSFIGNFLLIYSFLLVLAAALIIYRIAGITDPKDG